MSQEQQQWDIVSGVGLTALAVAAGRALETSRPDALISDPHAAGFVAAANPSPPMPTAIGELEEEAGLWASIAAYMGVRTRAFDDYLLQAAREGAEQIVLLAAGLDARAFRLPLPPETVCFELDQPAVLDFKLDTLAEKGAEARCMHRPVRVDLRDDWATALQEAGFDGSRPTAWLAEGLLPYLPAEAEQRLFSEIDRLSAPGSTLAVEQLLDYAALSDSALVQEAETMIDTSFDDLLHGDTRTPPDERLAALGWKARNVTADEAAEHYGRAGASAELTGHLVHTYARRP